ncbi:sugar phosphate nucleotidyltransferase [Paenibacillus sp. HGF5]|uniref:sugar phosphate nucleotidyltransferase n=1 Tax=Paenibacillus sp. HGF5 TaxID=908341 RepID=UPI0002072D22|nr:sugar phosphate nucleotidyltransferase [Paenibacillus sp. HGF5]EGG36451.1 glucose-1-phosphate thymidylyltransferase 1 [Paenibacillus sp. HGF5]
MKGVILAGGTGTRLYPLTKVINKHLLPVGKVPMICHGIEKFKKAGIEEILIVIGKQSAGLYTDLIGSGKEWGVSVTFKIQEEAGGIAQALYLAEPFITPGEKFVVLLGDNLFEDHLITFVQAFEKQAAGARVLLKKVLDPKRYGVPILEKDNIVMIEEKPEEPKSDYCVTGIYMYDSTVFETIRTIKPSARGELEITDVNNVYASKGQLTYDILDGWWTDAGTFQSLYQASGRLW